MALQMRNASSQIRVAYAHAAEITRVHIDRLHLTNDRARVAILRDSRIVNGLGKLGKVVVLIAYEDLHMGRAENIYRLRLKLQIIV